MSNNVIYIILGITGRIICFDYCCIFNNIKKDANKSEYKKIQRITDKEQKQNKFSTEVIYQKLYVYIYQNSSL